MAFAALTIDLNARLAKFEQDLSRASNSMDGLNRRAGALSAGLKAAFGALSVGALVSFAKSGIDAADALNDMSKRLSVSVKDLASFKLAAEQSGTSLESVGTGIARLSKSIGEAERGNKQLAKALSDLGITARDPKEAFFQLADAVKRIEDPTKRAALLSQVLGKSYGELVPLLSQGSEELRRSAEASKTFAEQMAKLAPDADKFNDQLAQMKINAAGFAATILNELVPALNKLFDRFSTISATAAAGGGLFANPNLTGIIAKDLPNINAQLRIAEKELSLMKDTTLDPFGEKDALTKRIAELKAMKAILRDLSMKGALDLAEQQYKKTPTKGGGAVDLSASVGKLKTINKNDIFSDEMARNAKLIADETERIAGDYAFMADVDIAQNTAEFAQQWTEAGRAMKQDMMTPLEQFEARLEYINELFRIGAIDVETMGRATADAFDKAGDKVKELDSFAKTAAENIQNAFADFLFDPFDDGLKGMLQSFGTMIQKMIAEAVAADLSKWLFGDLIKGGSGKGVAGGLLSAVGGLFSFAGGGYTGSGSRSGGVDGMGGFLSVLHPNETVVDHTKGQRSGNTIVINISGTTVPDQKRAIGQAAREVFGVMQGAQRYA